MKLQESRVRGRITSIQLRNDKLRTGISKENSLMPAWQLLLKLWCKSDGGIQHNVIYVKKQSSISSAQEGWSCFPQFFLNFRSCWCLSLQGENPNQLLAHLWCEIYTSAACQNKQNPGKLQNKEISFQKSQILQDLKDGTFQNGRLGDRWGLWGSSSFSLHQKFRVPGGFFKSPDSVPCSVLIQCQPFHFCWEWELSVSSPGSGGKESRRILNISQLLSLPNSKPAGTLQWHRKELHSLGSDIVITRCCWFMGIITLFLQPFVWQGEHRELGTPGITSRSALNCPSVLWGQGGTSQGTHSTCCPDLFRFSDVDILVTNFLTDFL